MNDIIKTVIIETPKESRLKYKFDPESGLFKVNRVLPLGLRFPFNFGFVPHTRAADGDPADVLLIMDETLYPGCGVDCRFIGVIEAEQTQKGRAYRNDRIIAASVHDRSAPKTLIELPEEFIPNVERFFSSYHGAEGHQFRVLRAGNSDAALRLIESATIPATI